MSSERPLRVGVVGRLVRRRDRCAPPGLLEAWRVDSGGGSVVVFRYRPEPPAIEHLTKAEREVVAGAIEGSSNAEIARARSCAERTVATLLARAYRKLQVSSRRELVARLAPAK